MTKLMVTIGQLQADIVAFLPEQLSNLYGGISLTCTLLEMQDINDLAPIDQHLEKEHQEKTKVKNIQAVEVGKYEVGPICCLCFFEDLSTSIEASNGPHSLSRFGF